MTGAPAPPCFLVPHTHWDREWYRTFEWFRARLVDALDRVLDLLAADPGFLFHLDGQTIVVEDYLALRPARRAELERACRAGRLAIGPWYVQPDSLIPSGEAHVRNLLEGRRVGAAIGPVSRVAYTPDSFGHPAQFPQLLAGFGLGPFVYWRGNDETSGALPPTYWWEAPDGSRVCAHHLREGYFNAAGLPDDPEEAAAWLATVVRRLEAGGAVPVVLMNGIDHAPPAAHTAGVAAALARRTGRAVRRAVLDDVAPHLPRPAATFRGELTGAVGANLLPGVWSARLPLKLRNRRCEALLEGWAEPWAALGGALGTPDERPALRAAWRALLQNQAHDSICGCSRDRVHRQMEARYDTAEELARETTARVLARLAGCDVVRETPWTDTLTLAVFNPSPEPRTDVVRVPLDPVPPLRQRGAGDGLDVHPLFAANLAVEGWLADGVPARCVADRDPARPWPMPETPGRVVEFVARDVPAFGWRRVTLRPAGPQPDTVDEGREIGADGLQLAVAADGTLTLEIDGRRYAGLCGLEDTGDRGDTYDADPVPGPPPRLVRVSVRRWRHASGLQGLRVHRIVALPAALEADRRRRAAATVGIPVDIAARCVPGTRRVDLSVRVGNRARDHRLRLLFPSGAPAACCVAATTFGLTTRPTGRRPAPGWVHPAPATFPQQGLVAVNGLVVAAPGLVEAEVTPAGVIALTLVRAVGWLARADLDTRPEPAGPALPTPGAQCLGPVTARLSLLPEADLRAARAAELGLRAVAAGAAPPLAPGRALLTLEPRALVLSALKPAEDGSGVVVRVLNPTDTQLTARLRVDVGWSRAEPVRLDETPAAGAVRCEGPAVIFEVPPRALRSVRLCP